MMNKTSIAAGALIALFAAAQLHAAGPAPSRDDDGSDRKRVKAEAASDEDEGPTRVVQGRNDIEGEIIGTPAKGSPFAKLEIGMTQDEVNDLVGAGKECGAYQTGKAWIPFRFSSNDVMRSECNYKGVGRLVFTQTRSESYLLKIVNNAGETGIRD